MIIGTQRFLKSLGMIRIVKKLAGKDSDDEDKTGDQGPPKLKS